jgi:hypothetical protein
VLEATCRLHRPIVNSNGGTTKCKRHIHVTPQHGESEIQALARCRRVLSDWLLGFHVGEDHPTDLTDTEGRRSHMALPRYKTISETMETLHAAMVILLRDRNPEDPHIDDPLVDDLDVDGPG